jgi:poly-gamma-glutamate capsule biosynthesis protein CapA/YwtB (metallophosphatase superfamily)
MAMLLVLQLAGQNPEDRNRDSLKNYEKTRIEGRSYWSAFVNTGPYIRKYISKRPETSPEILEYFRKQEEIVSQLKTEHSESGELRLAFIGDLMWIWYGWERFLSPEVLAELERHDVVLANLETPVDPSRRVSFPVPDHPSYNSPVELLTSFYSKTKRVNTLTAVSFANNHTFDRGEDGARATLRVLDSLGIGYSGVIRPETQEKPYYLIERNGIRIGFYATCWGVNKGEAGAQGHKGTGAQGHKGTGAQGHKGTGAQGHKGTGAQGHEGLRVNVIQGLAPLDPDKIDLSEVKSVLDRMKKDSLDFKIISIHWGFEFEFYPDPVIMEVGHQIVASGADLIIGSHPHVQQPNEICFLNGYHGDIAPFLINTTDSIPRKALIAYSLGNFCTPMYTRPHRTGQIQSMRLYRNPGTGRIDWTIPEFTKVYNENGRKWRTFRRLTLAT